VQGSLVLNEGVEDNGMILDGNDCKQKKKNLHVEELMEVVRKETAKVSLVVKVDLMVNLELIDLTHLKRR
jgi:hypothetical protein